MFPFVTGILWLLKKFWEGCQEKWSFSFSFISSPPQLQHLKSKILTKTVATKKPPHNWKINCRMPQDSSKICMLYLKMNGEEDNCHLLCLYDSKHPRMVFPDHILQRNVLLQKKLKKTPQSQIVFSFYNSTSCRWQHSLHNAPEHSLTKLSFWQSNTR